MNTACSLKFIGTVPIVLLLMLLASGCSKSSGKPGTQPNAKLEAIRQAGYPVTLAEHNAWYAEPPADENAAPLYAEAFAALSPADANSPSFLAQNQKALELLHRAASRKSCRYPIDLNNGANTVQPHLAPLKKCAQLLSQEARSHASKGRMDLAGQSILAGLRLARSLENEPVLISYLTQMAVEAIVQTSLEAVLNGKAFSSEQLTRLQTAFADAENGAALTRALAGERCLGIAFFQMPPPEQAKIAQATGGSGNTDMESYQKDPVFKADFDFYLDRMDECVTATTLPFPKAFEGVSEWTTQVDEAKTRGYQISGLLLPSLSSALERTAERAGRLRATQAALAVERYRLAHQNVLPDSLSQLMPQFLAAVPTDPFDGQPLRYKKSSPAGYVVYSIGKDRKDDGGKPRPAGAQTEIPFDLIFIVRR